MEVYHYHQFPPHLHTVHIALFTNVQNAADLRTRLVQAASMTGPEGEREREAVNFAFVDARLVSCFVCAGLCDVGWVLMGWMGGWVV